MKTKQPGVPVGDRRPAGATPPTSTPVASGPLTNGGAEAALPQGHGGHPSALTLAQARAGVQYHEALLARVEARTARVGIIGLGYVGLPLAHAFAGSGFPVLGFDVDAAKIAR